MFRIGNQGISGAGVVPISASVNGAIFFTDPTIVFDEFTDPNGTLITAHTIDPINRPLTSWTKFTAFSAVEVNIRGNTASNPTGSQIEIGAYCDSGVSDCTITGRIKTGGNIANRHGFIFRAASSASYWLMVVISSALIFQFNGVTQVFTPCPTSTNTWYDVSLTLSGNSMTGVFNGVVLNHNSAVNSNQTNHGFIIARFFTGTGACDDFRISQ